MRKLCVLTIASLALVACGSKTVKKGASEEKAAGAKSLPGKQYEDAKNRVQEVQQKLDDRHDEILEHSVQQ